ncbi:MAG: FAD binding domain-containing protein [Alphaproteobacteria bacterium]|nr:FAD binding domain-containing protein [Alphaproteobacteria bacterium]
MPVALRSRRHIAPFTLHCPETPAEALALQQEPGTSAFLAGGMEVIDRLKHGHTIERLIRLDGIPGLAAIDGDTAELRIGAMATHAALAESLCLMCLLPDLPTLWDSVANPRVRFAGTLGGNVMARRAEYDGLPALLALDAQAEIATAKGSERVTLDGLASPEALVTRFIVPRPGTRRLFADRSLRPALSLWLGLGMADDRITALRVAAGMAHPAPVCIALSLDLPLAELGAHAAELAAAVTAQLPQPTIDGRAEAAYRQRMVDVLTRRILIRAGGIV